MTTSNWIVETKIMSALVFGVCCLQLLVPTLLPAFPPLPPFPSVMLFSSNSRIQAAPNDQIMPSPRGLHKYQKLNSIHLHSSHVNCRISVDRWQEVLSFVTHLSRWSIRFRFEKD